MIFKAILSWLIARGEAAASLLPDHTPIDFPDMGPVWAVFTGLGAMDRFVDVRVLMVVVAAILMFELALLLYTVYRAVLGLIPAFK
jgi:hypothetical protein